MGNATDALAEAIFEFNSYSTNSAGGRRSLITMNQLDVTRDMMSFEFLLKSDMDGSEFEYDIILTNWTADGM